MPYAGKWEKQLTLRYSVLIPSLICAGDTWNLGDPVSSLTQNRHNDDDDDGRFDMSGLEIRKDNDLVYMCVWGDNFVMFARGRVFRFPAEEYRLPVLSTILGEVKSARLSNMLDKPLEEFVSCQISLDML